MASFTIVLIVLGAAIVVWCIMESMAREQENRAAFMTFLTSLRMQPLSPELHQEFRNRFANAVYTPATRYSEAVDFYGPQLYTLALESVAHHPAEAIARTFALEVGRWHMARLRPDGKSTATDEHVLQNDILMRSAATAHLPA